MGRTRIALKRNKKKIIVFMIRLLRNLVHGKNQNMSMKEALAVSHFPNATLNDKGERDAVPKKLGLTHSPKVKTILPDGHETLTFNQKTAALNRQLKKGLPKLKKASNE